jgi:drug/metabolite transporter (DMT)-like permease
VLPADLLGSLSGLLSAVIWGSGDFAGGLASRRISPFQTTFLAALSGIAVLLLCALAWGESLPARTDALWAAAGGLGGAVGIIALYRGLSLGSAALVAPATAVTATLVPVLYQLARRDPPSAGQMAGFAVALLGIWLAAQTTRAGDAPRGRGLWLALFSGCGFGVFFVLIGQVQPGSVFAPLAVARGVTLGLCLVSIWVRGERLPGLRDNPLGLLAGVLDAGGNIFYLLAAQLIRLDVAAVLSSLYPASTVILASVVTHEAINRRQLLGVIFCLAAVVMIILL